MGVETEDDRTTVDEVGNGVKRLIEGAAVAPIDVLCRAAGALNQGAKERRNE